MPRIRKGVIARSAIEIFWRIGLYIRLSREDENENESESVINQEKILRDFVNKYFGPGTYEIIGIFADDGLTGTDTDRPEFKRLENCIVRKEVNCMIVKSLARAFRNLADQQKFLDEFVPLNGTRFICTGTPFIDTYAAPRSATELEVPIRGMFNEQFAATTSEDVRRTFKVKRENGEFIGPFAPYGYVKDPDDKSRLLIDECAAEVVKSIYHWFVDEGYSKRGIANRLNQMGEPNPTAYKKKKGLKYCSPNSDKNDGLWCSSTIATILQNEVYTGTMVQGRNRVISYKVHKQICTPENEWFIVPNKHEAIIDRELFEKAQALHKRDTRTAPGEQKVYLLSGFVRCADCKKGMVRRSSRGWSYYACRSYTDKKVCSKHSIREDRLENAILTALQMQITLIDQLAEEIERINRAPAINRENKRLTQSLKQAEKKLAQYNDAIDDLYLDWKSGEITKEQIKAVATPTLDAGAFDLVRAITRREADKAFSLLDTLFANREEPVMLLAALCSTYADLYRAKVAGMGGEPAEALKTCFDYRGKEFRLRNAARDCASLDLSRLRAALELLSKADRMLKGSRTDRRVILEQTVAGLLAV